MIKGKNLFDEKMILRELHSTLLLHQNKRHGEVETLVTLAK
jgi:hypothetical protein